MAAAGGPIEPLDIGFEVTIETDKDGNTKESKRGTIATEDIIAIGAVIVAVIMALAMVFGRVPINKYTVGLAGFSGAGAVIAKIVKARKPAKQ